MAQVLCRCLLYSAPFACGLKERRRSRATAAPKARVFSSMRRNIIDGNVLGPVIVIDKDFWNFQRLFVILRMRFITEGNWIRNSNMRMYRRLNEALACCYHTNRQVWFHGEKMSVLTTGLLHEDGIVKTESQRWFSWWWIKRSESKHC